MTAVLTGEVTLRIPQGRDWTWADLQEIPDADGHRYEIVDGSLHVSASRAPWHQLVTSRIGGGLRAVAPDRLLVLEGVDIDFQDSVLEPDVLVVHEAAVTPKASWLLPPDVLLAVEVESRSSRRMDRLAKPSVYAAAGIPAYWRVVLDEPDAPAVVVHALDGDVYREVVTVRAGEAVTVGVPFEVELRPADLVCPRRRS